MKIIQNEKFNHQGDTDGRKAEPARHGRWIEWGEFFGLESVKSKRLGVFCSLCRLYADNKFDYCPNCGAKMAGDFSVEETPRIPIIRCQDCKYAKEIKDCFAMDGETPLYECGYVDFPHRGDAYCSWGGT